MFKPIRSPLLHYGIAVLSVALMLGVRWLLSPLLGEEAPLLPFMLAVTVSAWSGGLRPGLLATGLSSMAGLFFFIAPKYSFVIIETSDAVHLALFVVIGAVISCLSQALEVARQRAETSRDEARRYQEDMRQAEDLQRLMVDEVKDFAIIMNSPEGIITGWNKGAETIFGYTEAEILGQPTALLFTPEDRQQDAPEQELQAARENGRAEDERWHLRKDGSRFWASGVMSATRDARGELRGFVKVARDMTERKRLEEMQAQLVVRTAEARDEALAANRIKDEFLATLSHELRTPLNAILGWASLLSEGQLDEDEATMAADAIQRGAWAQNQLIEDLLDVSRIITGKLRLDVRPIDAATVITAAVETVRPAAAAKDIQLQTVLNPHVGYISGDANRLQQVIWNLVSNAIKFTPKGGRVEVRLERVASHVEIIVSDTGQGIAPEVLPHVFDRFRQADSSSTRRHGGLGLGLAIVRQLVELHGGTVEAHSLGLEQGTTFTIKLPLLVMHYETSENEDGGEPRRPAVEDATLFGLPRGQSWKCPPVLNGLRILVVDDVADGRTMIVALLKHCGAEVVAASSVAGAMQEIERALPDVLVSDIGMPDEDGYSLIAQVRALPPERGGRIPALALTAYATSEDRVRVLSAGFQMHVPKPIEPAELVTIVASLAERDSSIMTSR